MSARTLRLARYMIREADVQSRIRGILSKPQFKDIDPALLEDLATADPTGDRGDFLDWIFRNVNLKDISQKIRWPEDRERVKRSLTGFLKLKEQPRYFKMYESSPDINTYKLRELEALNRRVFGQHHLQESINPEDITKGASLFYQDEKFKIFRVGGPGIDPKEAVEAACKFGAGTEWCTAERESAKSYIGRGPLYVIYYKGQKFAQAHDNQLMDVADNPILINEYPKFWQELTEIGVFSKALFTFEYAKYVIKDRWPEGEKDLLNNKVYRLAYIRNVLDFGDTWPEAAPYIIRDKVPEEIYLYTIRCLGSKRWPEGEKALLSSKEPGVISYLLEYAANVIKGRWLEAEPRILGSKESYIIFGYANYCCNNQRVPEVEQALLESKDRDQAYYLARYAVEVIEGRWLEVEPLIMKDSIAFRSYIEGFNLDARKFIEAYIQDHTPKVKTSRNT